MKLRLHENSLFAILLRSQWWASALAALAMFGAVRLILPAGYAAFAALPFLVIAVVRARQQLRAPSRKRIAATLEGLRAMSWEEFSARLEEGFKRDGYEVRRLNGAQADLELESRQGQVSLVGCKRWKASRVGVEPLRALHAAAEARDADGIYVCTGEITDTAREFAAKHRIRLVQDAELARLVPGG